MRQGSCSARDRGVVVQETEEGQCKRQGNGSTGKGELLCKRQGSCSARDRGVVVLETGEL
jgi:hypothetical protein